MLSFRATTALCAAACVLSQASLSPAAWVQDLSVNRAFPPFQPTRVFVTVFSNSIRKISAPDSSFTFDAYVYFAWRDDRLINVTDQTVYTPNVASAWSPLPEFINLIQGSGGLSGGVRYVHNRGLPAWVESAQLPANADRTTGMYIVGQGRLAGSFLAQQILSDFPFDTQSAMVLLESTTWDSSSMRWIPAADATQGLLPPGFIIEGWSTAPGAASTTVSEYVYTSLAQTYSRLRLNVKCTRIPDFYMSRFVTNVTLIVLMALLALLQPSDFPTRMAVSQLAFGGIVSFLFVLSNTVPPLPYATRLDRYFSTSFFIVFFVYVYNAGMLSYLKRVADVIVKLQKGGTGGAAWSACVCAPRRSGATAKSSSRVLSGEVVSANPIAALSQGGDVAPKADAAAPTSVAVAAGAASANGSGASSNAAGRSTSPSVMTAVLAVLENWQIRADLAVVAIAAVTYGGAIGVFLRAPP